MLVLFILVFVVVLLLTSGIASLRGSPWGGVILLSIVCNCLYVFMWHLRFPTIQIFISASVIVQASFKQAHCWDFTDSTSSRVYETLPFSRYPWALTLSLPSLQWYPCVSVLAWYCGCVYWSSTPKSQLSSAAEPVVAFYSCVCLFGKEASSPSGESYINLWECRWVFRIKLLSFLLE